MFDTSRLLCAFGSYSTKWVGRHWGESFPFYYVIEYPKSGGNWLSHVIADYLDVPFIERSIFPHGVSCVTHSHWGWDQRLKRVFYLVRDGRDVCVSAFYHARRDCLDGSLSDQEYVRRRIGKSFIDALQRDNPIAGFSEFVSPWIRGGFGTKLSWVQHVRSWHRDTRGVVAIKYEDLLAERYASVEAAIEEFTGESVDLDKLKSSFARYSFAAMTGRTAGQNDPGAFRRKGVAGDWRNHFDQDTAQGFHAAAGATLLGLGYERDDSWIQSLPLDAGSDSIRHNKS